MQNVRKVRCWGENAVLWLWMQPAVLLLAAGLQLPDEWSEGDASATSALLYCNKQRIGGVPWYPAEMICAGQIAGDRGGTVSTGTWPLNHCLWYWEVPGFPAECHQSTLFPAGVGMSTSLRCVIAAVPAFIAFICQLEIHECPVCRSAL